MATDSSAASALIEIADELGEYCGKLLAGLGAEVIKVEPPGGEAPATYGPFAGDVPGPNRSLYFWHYNFGKRGVVLDLDDAPGQAAVPATAVQRRCRAGHPSRRLPGQPSDLVRQRHRSRLPGPDPRADQPVRRRRARGRDYRGSDLVHLALGGVMMNCGYDPDPSGHYDTPPIAPQMWQAYQIAGEMAAIGILGALHRAARQSGSGQYGLDVSVHEAVSMNTETDLPNWIYLRQTSPASDLPPFTADDHDQPVDLGDQGRSVATPLPDVPAQRHPDPSRTPSRMLERTAAEQDLGSDGLPGPCLPARQDIALACLRRRRRLHRQFRLRADDVWRERAGVTGWPGRRSAARTRTSTTTTGGSARPSSTSSIPDSARLDTDRGQVVLPGGSLAPRAMTPRRSASTRGGPRRRSTAAAASTGVRLRCAADRARPRRSARSPLDGVRIVDLCWLLASAGAGRFLAALGAEVHQGRAQVALGQHALGASAWPRAAVGPSGSGNQRRFRPQIDLQDPNRSGSFMEINAGKRGISLNIKHPRGTGVLKDLIRHADMVVEGFSPGTMDRMGLGYPAAQGTQSVASSTSSSPGSVSAAPTADCVPTVRVRRRSLGIIEMSGLPMPLPARWDRVLLPRLVRRL